MAKIRKYSKNKGPISVNARTVSNFISEECTSLERYATFMSGKLYIAKMPILSKAISTLDVIIQIPKGFYF